jgi:hydroxymethylbilane synthase
MKRKMKNQSGKEEVRLGTRASLLALTQAKWVKSQLEKSHPDVNVVLVTIKTSGDKIHTPLYQWGGKGLFVKEIEDSLLQGEVDFAVHSAKDLPSVIPDGLTLMAFPTREDPRDALISLDGKGWRDIPMGGKVGTSSLRRQAQLLHLRPDLKIVPLRGNLDTRIKKMNSLPLEAIVLASAGLHRLGWEEKISECFEPDVILPAAGQGVLAIEGRAGDERMQSLAASLNHISTQAALTAERAFVKGLGGGCQVPIAGLATIQADHIMIRGLVASLDGKTVIKGKVEGAWPSGEELGIQLAEELLAKGAGDILRNIEQGRQ